MTENNINAIFAKGTRKKVRFTASKCQLSIEQAWDLPLQSRTQDNLDDIAIKIRRQIREADEESFVTAKSPKNELLTLKLEILKYMISVKKEEIKEREDKQVAKTKLAELDDLIAEKQFNEKKETPLEELIKQRDQLASQL